MQTDKPSAEYRAKTLKIKGKRNHDVKGSVGVRDIYEKLPLEKRKTCDLKLFRKIIRQVNLKLCEEISIGNIVTIPFKMGRLYVAKKPTKNRIVDGKLENTMPVDWNRTMALWEEDNEAKEKKILVKHNVPSVFKLTYDKHYIDYPNKVYYHFGFNRQLKVTVKENINSGKLIDAFSIKYK